MSTVENKILEELNRYRKINRYIQEQDLGEVPPPAPGDEPPTPGGDVPPSPDAAAGAPPSPSETEDAAATETPQPVDVENDPDVEKIDAKGETKEEGDEDTEELDITDLVNSQKDIGKKQEDYFNQLFSHLDNLESKLKEMDNLVDKVNSLEQKLEKYRPRTPQEKLELRSLDSGPYNQKLSDFFIDKESDMQKSGKNEYVLTTDEVENFTPSEIRDTFLPDDEVKNFGF